MSGPGNRELCRGKRMTEGVYVYTPTETVGAYDDVELTYPSEPSRSLSGVAVEPGGSQEAEEGRSGASEALTLYLPLASGLGPSDRLRVRGEMYKVEGFPKEWKNPYSPGATGTVVTVTRMAG